MITILFRVSLILILWAGEVTVLSAQEQFVPLLQIPQAEDPSKPVDFVVRLKAIESVLERFTNQLENMKIGQSLPKRDESESEQLAIQLQQVQIQLQEITSQLLKPKEESDAAVFADMRLRASQTEEVLRSISGQMEQFSFHLAQLLRRFEEIAADTEIRFIELNDKLNSKMGEQSFLLPKNNDALSNTISQVNLITKGQDVALVGEADLLDTISDVSILNITDPKMFYDTALKNLRRGDYDIALTQLKQFLRSVPNHDLSGHAQYWLGEIYYVRRAYKQAASAFLLGYTKYAVSSKAPHSLLKLGMSLMMIGEKKTACDTFSELSYKFPKAPISVKKRTKIESQRAGCA